MAETTRLELVTPARTLVSTDVEMVVLPASEGLMGVLPRHAPVLTNLSRGQVEIHEGGKVSARYMIDGGVADVTDSRVIVLAERAESLDQGDQASLRARAEKASEADADFLNAVADAL